MLRQAQRNNGTRTPDLFPEVQMKRGGLGRAPSMLVEAMSELLGRELGVFIHAYFGAKPYWERAAQHS